MISIAAQYAVRALIFLAFQPSGEFVTAQDIARRLEVSGTFLAKILKRLVDAGFVESLRGPRGGLRLRVGADRISVRDVVVAIDGIGLFTDCVLGLPGCGERMPCPMHERWAETRKVIERDLAGETIGELAKGVKSGERRVAP
jgi:Rrf2 family protein